MSEAAAQAGADKEQQEILRVFQEIDADGSGDIDAEELVGALKALGMDVNVEASSSVLQQYTKSDSLDLKQFAALVQAIKQALGQTWQAPDAVAGGVAPSDADHDDDADPNDSSEDGRVSAFESFTVLLAEALTVARSEVIAAKVPISGYGRVNSAFDTIKPKIVKMGSEMLQRELSSLRTSASEALEALKRSMDEQRIAEVAEKVGAVEAQRDAAVAIAEEARAAAAAQAQAAQAEVETVLSRRSGAQELVEKVEAELVASEEKRVAAELRSDRLEEKVARFEAKQQAIHDEWESSLLASLKLCTLKPRKDAVGAQPDSKAHGVFKRQPRSVGDQLKAEMEAHKKDHYGAKAASLLAVYEEAKQAASAVRKRERDEAAEALSALAAEKDAEEVRLVGMVQEREQQLGLKDKEVAAVMRLKAAEEAKVEALHEKLSTVHPS